MPNERWRDVIGYEGLYQVSDLGRMWSLYVNRVMKPAGGTTGYPHVILHKDGVKTTADIHILVLTAFVGPCPKGQECLHGSVNRADVRLVNLSWGTRTQNLGPDKLRDGTDNRGVKNAGAKLTLSQARIVKQRAQAHNGTQDEIASTFGITQSMVSRIKLDKAWSNSLAEEVYGG